MDRIGSGEARADDAVSDAATVESARFRHESAHDGATLGAELDRSVAAAVRWVRSGGPAWRFGRHNVYRLPWYVVIGEDGAGKSTLLRASGFRPGRRGVHTSEASDDRPMRWWFGSDAVLFEAKLGDAADDHAWLLLMQRLKRARRRCPLNGIVVLAPAHRITDGDEAHRSRASDALRARIAQAYRICKRRVPVYVLLTHADRLAGCEAFVGDMAEATHERPLGLVFPLKTTLGGDARTAEFSQAYDVLVRGAKDQLIARLPVRADSSRAAMTYRFPRSLKALSLPLARFVSDTFDATPEQAEPVLLRAVHLSAVLGNDMAIAPRTPEHAPKLTSCGARVCFGAQFLRDVVFSGRDLVFTRHAVTRGRVVVSSVAAIVTVMLAACLSVALSAAYWRGSAAIAATAPAATELVRAAQSGIDRLTPRAMLGLLDAAHGLPCGEAWQSTSGDWLAALALAREMHLERACRAAYRTVLQETLQPYIAARMTETLSDASADSSTQYAMLRAYLMLGDRTRYDRATMSAWIERQASGAGLSASERAAWRGHAAAWADSLALESNLSLDPALIARVRARLSAQPAAQRVFADILSKLEAATPEPLSIADMAGPGAALAFYRRSGQPLSDGVPGAFTLAGMRRYAALRDVALDQALAESWVLGPAGVLQMRTLADEVDRLYFTRYVAAWDSIIGDVGLRPLLSSGDSVSMVEWLAGPESPMRAFLTRAASETTLTAAATMSRHSAPTLRGPFRAAEHTLRRWLARAPSPAVAQRRRDAEPTMQAQALVDRHFEALHDLVLVRNASPQTRASADASASNPLDQARAQLKEVAVYLKAAALARANGMLPPPDDALARLALDAAGWSAPLGPMLEGLAQDGAMAARTAEHARIGTRWRAEVAAFCHAAVDGRYPFAEDAEVDVRIDDFTRLFAPGGLLDAFFRTNLQAYVDTTTSPWTWRSGVAPPDMSAAALAAFERAARIRDAFFPEQGKAMDVRFTLTPRRVDIGATHFAFALGGQTMTYAGGSPVAEAFKWPVQTAQALARVDDHSDHSLGDDTDRSVEAKGAWSLFRLLDRGRLTAHTPDRFGLIYAFGGHDVELELTASSVINPFEASGWRAFRCPSGL